MAERVLTSVYSLGERLNETLSSHRNEIVAFLSWVEDKGKGILQRHQVFAEFEVMPEAIREALLEGPFDEIFKTIQEAVVLLPWVALAVRPRPGVWEYVRVNVRALLLEQLQVNEYLHFKKELVDDGVNGNFVLELDFVQFNASFPRPALSKSISNGVEFLNRHLSVKLFHDKESLRPLLEFLRVHRYAGTNMTVNARIKDVCALQHVLRKAEDYLTTVKPETPFSKFKHKFQEIGLERAWGDTAEHVLEMNWLLLDLLEIPDHCTLEKFLGRIPMVFDVVIMSPHGYFAQDNILGYPDTGGQVIYISDEVRALETEMLRGIEQQGLDITPRILIITRLLPDAVGMTDENGIVRKWISRFEVWPYLERYTKDVASEIAEELHGKPDLIIGNYSDGNIVASLLAHQLGVMQMNRAELYRCICDMRGAFVQPAVYEAFSLTVVKAMTCGLPTFATINGGPAEIIVHGKSGYPIDPYQSEQAAEILADFFEKCRAEPSHWDKISQGSMQRIREKYTWQIYSERLLNLTAVYGFWKHVSNLDRLKSGRFLEMFYSLKYHPLAQSVPRAKDD